ncbi:hypothetical protein SAMN02910384_00690 [Pseudobutyrivibrio sp. ACV-2]|uniref:hypothetical protein n=1 Tax=Pseudobutyrivibrio sp. ACV-2 TaxID=1520801 RepID=UPI000896D08E|nr:hypothetical protein [Pseudobutyrivibrio sp. ACV-2]SEA03665.1 hypothetical protein SAMN02910384_00690 [Pseudobutyrivibrio sp. ACV-2]
MDLMLATSKAGHDAKQVYVVIEEIGDYYMIVNGTTKTMIKPKKKKKIHLQLIKNLPTEVFEIYDSSKPLDDLTIKRILKVYNRRNKDV